MIPTVILRHLAADRAECVVGLRIWRPLKIVPDEQCIGFTLAGHTEVTV
jgi:hypothetical protein